MSTKLGVTENFVSSLYLLIQSSTLKKCIEHCLTTLATLLHVYIYIYIIKVFCYVDPWLFFITLSSSVEIYHLLSHIFRTESVKYNENYTRAAKRPEVIIQII